MYLLTSAAVVLLPTSCSRHDDPPTTPSAQAAATTPTPAHDEAALAAEVLARLGHSQGSPGPADLPAYVRLNLGRMAIDPWRMSDAEIKLARHPPARATGQATIGSPRVKLVWQTQRENNPFGFFVYRADDAAGANRRRLNPDQPLLAERGFTDTPHRYVFYDLDVTAGQTYYYRVLALDMAGKLSWIVGESEVPSASPKPLTAAEVDEIKVSGTAFRVTLDAPIATQP